MQNEELLYFKDRNGNLYTKQTKNEIKDSINPLMPKTFIHILKDMDYPYFEEEWGITLAQTARKGDLKNVFGKYISKMRLQGFKIFSFKDSQYNEDLTEFRFKPYGINKDDNNIYKYSINKLKKISSIHNNDNKEKIIKILINELCYCYCDNCEFGNWDKYQDTKCDNCYRKYQNWALSQDTATLIADKIIKEVNIND